MAQKNFGVNVNLRNNQLLNATLQNLSVAPSTTGLTQGFVYWNTADKTAYAYTGLASPNEWLDLGEVYVHPVFPGTGQPTSPLTGAQVISQITLNNGHVTAVQTRPLTAADIGAASANHMHPYTDIVNVTSGTVLGRKASGTGATELLSQSDLLSLLAIAHGTATQLANDSSTQQRTWTALDIRNYISSQINNIVTTNALTSSQSSTSATITSNVNGVSSSTNITGATTTQAGVMTASDKTKLDGIQAGANNYTHPNHSGDVTSVGDGATTIATNAVTFPKMQNIATQTFLGRATAGTGNVEALTVAQMQTLLGFSTQTLSNSASNLIVSNTVQRAALTGDVTASQNSNATTIANGVVTNVKMANMAANTFKGRLSTAGAPQDLTVAQMQTALGLTPPNNGLLTISTSSDLTGGGTFSADQATASNVNIGLSSSTLASLALANTAVQPSALGNYVNKAGDVMSGNLYVPQLTTNVSPLGVGVVPTDGGIKLWQGSGNSQYGIAVNAMLGGIDIMANQNGQGIRFWGGTDNSNPTKLVTFGSSASVFEKNVIIPNATAPNHAVAFGQLANYALLSQVPTNNNQLTNGANYTTLPLVQSWVSSQGFSTQTPNNGTFTVQGTGALTGSGSTSANASANTSATLDLTTQAKLDIKQGTEAKTQVTSLFADAVEYFRYYDMSGGGFVDTNEAFFNLVNPKTVSGLAIDISDHHINGARLVLQSVTGVGGIVTYKGRFIMRNHTLLGTLVIEGDKKLEYVWDVNVSRWREVF